MSDRVLISSFETRFLARIADRANAPAVGVLTDRRIGSDPLSLCKRLRAFSWHPDFRSVTTARVRAMHAAGIMVFPYTVNQPEDFRALLQMGVDGVFTDDPPTLQTAIGSAAGNETPPL
jgi:glycerophosphoryl diester phosphodiesterase